MLGVKERLKLDILRTDHVVIRSELKYLIGWKMPGLPGPGFPVETGPKATVRVFPVVRPVETVRFRVEPDPEPTREIGPVANTTLASRYGNASPSRGNVRIPQRPMLLLILTISKTSNISYDRSRARVRSLGRHIPI